METLPTSIAVKPSLVLPNVNTVNVPAVDMATAPRATMVALPPLPADSKNPAIVRPIMYDGSVMPLKKKDTLTYLDQEEWGDHTCTECRKTFLLKSDYQRHLDTHKVEKKFECCYCGKCFATYSVMFLHRRTHTGEKPHKCDLCSKAFTKKYNLICHKRTHTGEKPFTCGHCSKSYGDMKNLKKHLIRHAEDPNTGQILGHIVIPAQPPGPKKLRKIAPKPLQDSLPPVLPQPEEDSEPEIIDTDTDKYINKDYTTTKCPPVTNEIEAPSLLDITTNPFEQSPGDLVEPLFSEMPDPGITTSDDVVLNVSEGNEFLVSKGFGLSDSERLPISNNSLIDQVWDPALNISGLAESMIENNVEMRELMNTVDVIPSGATPEQGDNSLNTAACVLPQPVVTNAVVSSTSLCSTSTTTMKPSAVPVVKMTSNTMLNVIPEFDSCIVAESIPKNHEESLTEPSSNYSQASFKNEKKTLSIEISETGEMCLCRSALYKPDELYENSEKETMKNPNEKRKVFVKRLVIKRSCVMPFDESQKPKTLDIGGDVNNSNAGETDVALPVSEVKQVTAEQPQNLFVANLVENELSHTCEDNFPDAVESESTNYLHINDCFTNKSNYIDNEATPGEAIGHDDNNVEVDTEVIQESIIETSECLNSTDLIEANHDRNVDDDENIIVDGEKSVVIPTTETNSTDIQYESLSQSDNNSKAIESEPDHCDQDSQHKDDSLNGMKKTVEEDGYAFTGSETVVDDSSSDKPKPHICDICQKSFQLLTNLHLHQRCHNGERPYVCHVCDKSFTHKSNLNRHLRIHNGSKPYVCGYCGKAFIQSSGCKEHVKIHLRKSGALPPLCTPEELANKPYQCTHCEKRFPIKKCLVKHMSNVHGGRMHICNVCSKSFVRIEHFRRHYKMHTGEKNFECKQCGAKFAENYDLKVHMRRHQDVKPFECPHCQMRFCRSADLRKHESRHERAQSGGLPFQPRKATRKRLKNKTDNDQSTETTEELTTYDGQQNSQLSDLDNVSTPIREDNEIGETVIVETREECLPNSEDIITSEHVEYVVVDNAVGDNAIDDSNGDVIFVVESN